MTDISFEKGNKSDSPINSEEEFWNPTKNDSTEDPAIEQMRAQFRKYLRILYISFN